MSFVSRYFDLGVCWWGACPTVGRVRPKSTNTQYLPHYSYISFFENCHPKPTWVAGTHFFVVERSGSNLTRVKFCSSYERFTFERSIFLDKLWTCIRNTCQENLLQKYRPQNLVSPYSSLRNKILSIYTMMKHMEVLASRSYDACSSPLLTTLSAASYCICAAPPPQQCHHPSYVPTTLLAHDPTFSVSQFGFNSYQHILRNAPLPANITRLSLCSVC